MPSSAGAVIRKRKSNSMEGTPRKILAEINAGSGLPVPGWTKASTKKTPKMKPNKGKESKGRDIIQTLDLAVELPTETVEDLLSNIFGEVNSRIEKQANLLKRTKPEQKLFGYAKTFLDFETKRLAVGLKETYHHRDIFYHQCKDLEFSLRNAVSSTRMKAERIVANAKETRNKLNNQENEIVDLRQREIKASKDLATATTELDHAKKQLDSSSQFQIELEKKVNIFEKEVSFLRSDMEKKNSVLEKLNNELINSKTEMEHITGTIRTQLESQIEKLVAEKEQSSADVEDAFMKMKEMEMGQAILVSQKNSVESEMKCLELESGRLKVSLDSATMQIASLESQAQQKDSALGKTLDTLQQSQAFSQERIAATCAEKVVLETRINELSETKARLDLEKANLDSTIKELSRNNTSLTEALESKSLLLQSIEAEFAEMKEMHASDTTKLASAKAQVSMLTEQIVTARADLKDTQEKLQLDQERMSTENNNLTSELEKLQISNETLESELEAVKQTYSSGGSTDDRLEQLCAISKEAEMLKRQVHDQSSMHSRYADMEKQLKEAKDQLFESDRSRRILHNEIQDLKGKVRVVARVRPSNTRNDQDGDKCMDEDLTLVCGADGMELQVETVQEQSTGSTTRQNKFKFDRVFAPNTKQYEVFGEVQSFVQSALDGYNVCLFSYGQTGSGKTYTMTGDHTSDVHRGIIPRAISNIMSHQKELRDKGWLFSFQASFVEIYNESIRDLLTSTPTKLEVRDSKSEINVPGVIKLDVKDQEDVDNILSIAAKNRSVAATDLNLESSRSHSVFTLFISGMNDQYKAQLAGSLSMCDLAGSERISRSNVSGDRLKETQAINKSLSSLADVFASLSKKTAHVPYRNSKLTHMLQPCFAGQGKTMMILNLSSDSDDVAETMCSLRFGSQVNKTELGKAKKQISNV